MNAYAYGFVFGFVYVYGLVGLASSAGWGLPGGGDGQAGLLPGPAGVQPGIAGSCQGLLGSSRCLLDLRLGLLGSWPGLLRPQIQYLGLNGPSLGHAGFNVIFVGARGPQGYQWHRQVV